MPGSDQKINYQIRPSKAIERKMMCELIRQLQIIQGENDFRYIGMGAKYFVDFVLFHNEFGIKNMISIEADIANTERYLFNNPLKTIRMLFGNTNEVLPQITDFDKQMNVIWLDYDDAFNKSMIEDIKILSHQLYPGSVFFLSCNTSYSGTTADEKKESFLNAVGNFFDEEIPNNQYTGKNLPRLIRRIIFYTLDEEIRKRNLSTNIHLDYLQVVFFTYRDGAPMMTLGVLIVDDDLKDKIDNSSLFSYSDYCIKDQNSDAYSITVPKLTYKEIQLIMKNIPMTELEYAQDKDSFYGISYKEIDNFQRIYRYYPYYVESSMNT